MDQVPVHNPTNMPIWVGSTCIPPKETRHFPPHQVPAHLMPTTAPVEAAAPSPEPNPDPIVALLGLKIDDIVGAFPTLSDEQLDALNAAEAAAGARKGLLAAVGEESLRRADVAEIRKQLATFDVTTLEAHYANLGEASPPNEVAAVEAEMAARGLGRPALLARFGDMTLEQLQKSRSTTEDEAEIAVLDDLIAQLSAS